MTQITDVSHAVIYKDPEHKHCCNQASIKQLSNGEVVVVFNEERFPFHHDSGQTVLMRSRDGGDSWDEATRQVVLPFTQTMGNWDCGITEISPDNLMINVCLNAFYKRGTVPQMPSWSGEPVTEEWGDWTWTYLLKTWLGTIVLKSSDNGATWSTPIPVNVRPLKHGGTRLGVWTMPNGAILMGVYGSIRNYGLGDEFETIRAAIIRSDDGGDNWEYYSTLAYDAASIIGYSEPALVRLDDGRLVCMLRTGANPSKEAKNLAFVVSEDEGFSWSQPRFTNIWGYPAELINLQDGRILMVYGYRRPPYGVRACISQDGLDWDVANEFVLTTGGVPASVTEEKSTAVQTHIPVSGVAQNRQIDREHPGFYQHIGYPSIAQLQDGSLLCAYHEWSDDPRPIQYVRSIRFSLSG